MSVHDPEMRKVLGQLALVSNGTTMAWNTSGGGKAGSKAPASGESDAPHLRWARAYGPPFWAQGGCSTDLERSGVLRAASAELESAKRGSDDRPEGETAKQRRHRILREGEGWSPVEVALALRVPVSEVRDARNAHGRDLSTGKVAVAGVEDTGLAARLLKRQGFTQADIARRLGVSQPTVSRILRPSRAA